MRSIPACTTMRNRGIKVAVLSGKGGTGKTLVSVNLASVGGRSAYVDCDVEEPNGHLFFKPCDISGVEVSIKVPYLVNGLCTGCRECVGFCRFNAMAFVYGKPLLFEEVCHSCGGCALVCPEGALLEKDKAIGRILSGTSDNVEVRTGMLDAGQASGIPIIRRLLADGASPEGILTFIDCPPGNACAVMESIKDADYCVLVAEPTLFGVHNLNMAYELVRLFKKPYGVVLNKCLEGDNPAERFCTARDIKVLGRIPYDDELGRISSDARIATRESVKYEDMFLSLLENMLKEARHETAAGTQR